MGGGGGEHPSGEALEAELAAVRERLYEVESAARGRSERARAGVAAARAEAQEAHEEAASLRAALESALADASAARREAERAAAAARETDASAAESVARAEAAASAASAASLARQQELEGAVEGARERAEHELRAEKDAGEARAQALQDNIDSIHRRAAEEGAQAAARIKELEVTVRAGAAKTAQGTRAAAEAGARRLCAPNWTERSGAWRSRGRLARGLNGTWPGVDPRSPRRRPRRPACARRWPSYRPGWMPRTRTCSARSRRRRPPSCSMRSLGYESRTPAGAPCWRR